MSCRGFHTVLRKEIESGRPQVGDLMAVVYMGTERSSRAGKFAGKMVHIYRVVVQKSGQGSGAPSSSPPDTRRKTSRSELLS